MNGLYHHGILGQKWGVRRYQNYDGTLTSAGKKRKYKTESGSQMNYDRTIKDNWVEIYNRAVKYTNENVDKFNAKWEKEFVGYSNWTESPKYQEYEDAYDTMFDDFYKQSALELFGNRPTR